MAKKKKSKKQRAGELILAKVDQDREAALFTEATAVANGFEPMDDNDWEIALNGWEIHLLQQNYAGSTVRNKMAAARQFLKDAGHLTEVDE